MITQLHTYGRLSRFARDRRGTLADPNCCKMDPQQVLVEVRARTVVKVLTIVLAAAALVEVLSAARDVLILLGISLFLAVALNPAVVLVQRWLPRGDLPWLRCSSRCWC